jgi:sugar transferase (PEP-CTERM system associated)
VLRIFRHYMSVAALCLFACEWGVVVIGLYIAANSLAPMISDRNAVHRYLGAVLVPAILTSMLLYALGLYDRQQLKDFRGSLPRLAAFLLIFAPTVAISLNISQIGNANASAGLYASWTAVLCASILVARFGYVALTKTVAPRRILVVGVGKLAAELEFLTRQRHSATDVVGYFSLARETPEVPSGRLLPTTSSLLDVARETAVGEVVVALDDRRGAPLAPLLEARMEGIKITNYLSFWERETRRVNLKALDPSWLIYSDGFRVSTVMNSALKRMMDIVASLSLLIIMLPTMVLVAVAIRLDSPGPIFYKQERVGRNGSLFKIYKFRTMRADAENSGIPQWASLHDPRITRIGSFLRMMRIDELPQVLNVLRGDMSFVGPRPERPFFVHSLSRDIPFYLERHRVRPGITGWAQINYPYGASIEDAKAKLSYDLYYIKNFSLLFDLLIILSTAQAVLFKKGGR